MQPVILWFRRNLRVLDNAALLAAVNSGCPLIPLYINDSQDRGGASRWWLHQSLSSLDRDLCRLGSSLLIRSGEPEQVLTELSEQTGARALYYAKRFEPESRRQEKEVAVSLGDRLEIETFDDSFLHTPESVLTQAGTPYRVFTAYWRTASGLGEPCRPLPAPKSIKAPDQPVESVPIDELGLLSVTQGRAAGFDKAWTPGEAGGLQRVDDMESILSNYAALRDRPDVDATSRLSPHLCFGEISVRQVWHAARQLEMSSQTTTGAAALCRQLYWRDFSSYMLFHFPSLPSKPLRQDFEHFPWSTDEALLQAWQSGRTGYPMPECGNCSKRAGCTTACG